MDNPYLNSGESLIQSTDRISVNGVSCDLLITTRRLVLADNTHAMFEPMQIPFSTIVSLRGGWNPDGDPAITLTLTDPEGTDRTRTLDLIFSQQAGEHRKEECDGWVEYLMDQIVLARQETYHTSKTPADQEKGIQPSVRRWVAPERIQPHTTMAVQRPVPSAGSLTPVQPHSPPVTDDHAGSGSDQSEKIAEEAAVAERNGMQSEDSILSAATAIEECADAGVMGKGLSDLACTEPHEVNTVPAHQEGLAGLPGSSGILSQKPAGQHGQEDALPFMTTGNTEGAETKILPEVRMSAGAPEMIQESPGVRTPWTEESLTVSVAPGEREELREPEVLHELTGVSTTIPPAYDMELLKNSSLSAGLEAPDSVSLPEGESPALSATVSKAPENIVWPVIHTKEPETPPPPSTSNSHRKIFFVAVGICAVLLAIAGGVLFYSNNLPDKYDIPKTPETIPTAVITQLPALPEFVIPKTGIWVRVECNTSYLGFVGNPGSTKMVSGSGNQLYQIRPNAGAVQASFQKQEYTGDTLTVEIYNNGQQVAHRTTTAPKGSIDFIIDPNTGEPFGIPVNHA